MEDIYRGEFIQLAPTSMQHHHHRGKLDIYSSRIQFMQTCIKTIDLTIYFFIYSLYTACFITAQQTHQNLYGQFQ